MVSAIRKRLYQYGTEHDDKKLNDDPGKTCDGANKFCSSSFIKTPLLQVFDSQFKTIKVSQMFTHVTPLRYPVQGYYRWGFFV